MYDPIYQGENAEECLTVVRGAIVEENQNEIEEEVYEVYDGDYQEYDSKSRPESELQSESWSTKFYDSMGINHMTLHDIKFCTRHWSIGSHSKEDLSGSIFLM